MLKYVIYMLSFHICHVWVKSLENSLPSKQCLHSFNCKKLPFTQPNLPYSLKMSGANHWLQLQTWHTLDIMYALTQFMKTACLLPNWVWSIFTKAASPCAEPVSCHWIEHLDSLVSSISHPYLRRWHTSVYLYTML